MPRLADDVAALRRGLRAAQLQVGYATLAVRRRDWLAAEHSVIEAMKLLVKIELAESEAAK